MKGLLCRRMDNIDKNSTPRMTYAQKLEAAKRKKIHFDFDVLKATYPGVYCFYAFKNTEKTPFYVGKAFNIRSRMLDASDEGHVHCYLSGTKTTKLVQSKIKDYLDNDYEVHISLVKKVSMKCSCAAIAFNKLALTELQAINSMQKNGYCLEQYPEGTKPNNIASWNEKYLTK